MAPLVIASGAVIRLIWSRAGAPYAVNVLGAVQTGAPTFNQALANSLGSAIKTRFTSSGFAARVSSDISLSQVAVRNIAIANQGEFVDAGAAVPGTAVGDPLPGQVALAITLRTANAGPSFRGRVYLPGWSESSNDTDGTCLSADGAAGLAFVSGIQTDMFLNGLTNAVLSRPRDASVIPAKTIEAKAGFATQVTAAVLRDLAWDTQRRRLTAGV